MGSRTRSASLARRAAPAAALCLALLAPGAARAAGPKQFLALLNAGQETPVNDSTAQGVAHLFFNDSDKMLCFAISFADLSTPEAVAHIHGDANSVPGVAAAPIFDLPLGNPKSGCVGPLDGPQKKLLQKNLLYINIHSEDFINGEIRGQILRIK
jgi:hypothetical protein